MIKGKCLKEWAYIYSPDIPISSGTSDQFPPGIGTHSFSVISLV